MNITILGRTKVADERLNFIISELAPETVCIIVLKLQYSWCDVSCKSYGLYKTDQNGIVNLAETAPIEGNYKGIDSMGLFASCKEMQPVKNIRYERDFTREYIICSLTVTCCGEKIEKSFTRYFTNKEVQYKRVTTPVTGHYFYHSDKEKTQSILLLGGSEGVANPMLPFAACLANKGFNVLSLQYFSPAGDPQPIKELPAFLRLIPVEYINAGIDWLCKMSGTADVSIMGFSRGAELALLTSTLNEKVKKVIAVSPSAYVWQGIYTISSAWSLERMPIPCLVVSPILAFIESIKNTIIQIFNLPQGYYLSYELSRNLIPDRFKEKARIKIEKTEAHILLVAGKKDFVWNSVASVKIIKDTMEAHHKGEKIFCKIYENAGHYFQPPFLFGEEVKDTKNKTVLSKINEDFWNSVIIFLSN